MNDDCDFPLGGRCSQLFDNPVVACDQLVRRTVAQRAQTSENEPVEPPSDLSAMPLVEQTPAPWRGSYIKFGEFGDLCLRSTPRLIGIVGPHGAGKTSLLASFFLQIANGQYESLPFRFASSRSLLAFDQLVVRANQWSGDPETQILDHTSRDTGAQFLHLGLRPFSSGTDSALDKRHIDILISDIAGESTTAWSQQATGEAAETMAFIRHAQAILVLADASKLVDLKGRAYDGEIAGLLRRVGHVVRGAQQGPRVSLVFTKIDKVKELLAAGPRSTTPFSDAEWSPLLRGGAIRTAMQALSSLGVAVSAYSVSAFPAPMSNGQPLGIMSLFQETLVHSCRSVPARLTRPDVMTTTSWFDRYGLAPKEWEQ